MKRSIPVSMMVREKDEVGFKYTCPKCGMVIYTVNWKLPTEDYIKADMKQKFFSICGCGARLRLLSYKKKWVYSKHKEFVVKIGVDKK